MSAMAQSRKPWEHAKSGGSEADPLAQRFVESLSYDTRLYKHDIAGSIAHARMLQHVGLITQKDLAAIERGLGEIEAEIDAQGERWGGWLVELEDVHMCIEAALIKKIGEPGKKLHTGRSRNDQVATDLLLWCSQSIMELTGRLEQLNQAFIDLADRDGRVVMPSYTHLQRAQPVVVGGELLAWVNAFDRCATRLSAFWDDGAIHDVYALGSGAIAGSSLPLDRRYTQSMLLIGVPPSEGMTTEQYLKEVGLPAELSEYINTLPDAPAANAIDSTASRDVAVDFAYGLSMTAMWLSRWAEQWIIYMTAEFGFLSLGDAYTTGSSMMPQKRNPDMLELIRGRCGGVYGHLVALLTMCKGITIGYNRDLQEDKRHVFAAYDTVKDCLDMATRIVKSAKFNEQRITQSLDRGFLDATSLAEHLVTKGVAFRTAHQYVGALVNHCIEQGIVKLADLTVEQMKQIAGCDAVGDDVYEWLGPENVVKRYQTDGNAGLTGFEQQLAEWKERLESSHQANEPSSHPEAAGGLFGDDVSGDASASLIVAYEQQKRTLDDLPYTDQFEAIIAALGTDDRYGTFHRLHNLRKAGQLPKVGKAWEKPPVITAEQEELLAQLVIEAVGSLSKRDQLPYAPPFDEVIQKFNAQADLQFTPHQVWRVVAKLAK